MLVAGPVDDETPKLADCGIARIDGIAGTVAAMTPSYGGPEQMLSKPWERNPLVGTWTDVHALAAVAWFVLGGEHWCHGENDAAWHRGARRSLHSAPRVHPALHADGALLDRIDAALIRGASQRLPASSRGGAGAGTYDEEAQRRFPRMFEGEPRFASPGELAAALLPPLELCAAAWETRCTIEGRPSTAYRSTEVVGGTVGPPPVSVREVPWSADAGVGTLLLPEAMERVTAGAAVFQPDGKVLVRLGERLLYVVGDRPLKVAVPHDHRSTVAASRWIVRGPGGGFALVGDRHVLLVRSSRFTQMAWPARPWGGEVGDIQAAIGAGGIFGVVTAETDDSNGGAELWTSPDGVSWAPPVVLPLGGDVHAVSRGPHGILVVGSRRAARGGRCSSPSAGTQTSTLPA